MSGQVSQEIHKVLLQTLRAFPRVSHEKIVEQLDDTSQFNRKSMKSLVKHTPNSQTTRHKSRSPRKSSTFSPPPSRSPPLIPNSPGERRDQQSQRGSRLEATFPVIRRVRDLLTDSPSAPSSQASPQLTKVLAPQILNSFSENTQGTLSPSPPESSNSPRSSSLSPRQQHLQGPALSPCTNFK